MCNKINIKDVAFALALKSSQLQRENGANVEKEQILDVLFLSKWKKEVPKDINKVLNDIFTLEISEIVATISVKIATTKPTEQLAELHDLIVNGRTT